MGEQRPVASRIRVREGAGAPPSVDGHPGWVAQSVRQYAALCAVLVGMQGLLAGVGYVLIGATSAAWWCVLLGALSGMLIWVPLFSVMHGEAPRTLDEAFCTAYGRIAGGFLSILYTAFAFMDAAQMLQAFGSLMRQYLLVHSDALLTSLGALCMLALLLVRHGVKGLARLFWLIRKAALLLLVACMALMLSNIETNNLFPIMGNSIQQTLLALPAAGNGFIGILLLGLLPRMTGSAKQVPFRTGVYALFWGGLFAVLLMLITNLNMPPRSIPHKFGWGDLLMLNADFQPSHLLRLVYMLITAFFLMLGSGTSIAAGGMLLSGAFQSRQHKQIAGGVCILMFVCLIILDTRQLMFSEVLSTYRLPAVVLPLWVTWAVLAVRKRRKGAGK